MRQFVLLGGCVRAACEQLFVNKRKYFAKQSQVIRKYNRSISHSCGPQVHLFDELLVGQKQQQQQIKNNGNVCHPG
jgi:hypothetical protein